MNVMVEADVRTAVQRLVTGQFVKLPAMLVVTKQQPATQWERVLSD